MIEYRNSLEAISEDMLDGFFVGWPNPPSKAALYFSFARKKSSKRKRR